MEPGSDMDPLLFPRRVLAHAPRDSTDLHQISVQNCSAKNGGGGPKMGTCCSQNEEHHS